MRRITPQLGTVCNMERIIYPCYASPKIDGVRGIFFNGLFTSRSDKKFQCLFPRETFQIPQLEGLDGELCVGSPCVEGAFATTMAVLNTRKLIGEEASKLKWYIFDYVTPETQFLCYGDRLKMALQIVKTCRVPSVVPITLEGGILCKTLVEVKIAVEANYKAGYEGTVLRGAKAIHKSGRSTIPEGGFLKVKKKKFGSGTIVNCFPAHDKHGVPLGRLGMLEVQSEDFITVIKIGAGKMSHADRKKFLDNPSLCIGKSCSFSYMAYGTRGLPRQPNLEKIQEEV